MSRPGDWNCRQCNHLNFQWRDSCQRCSEPRPPSYSEMEDICGNFVGRGSGSSSYGFSTGPDVRPGDWYCTVGHCGTHNFANRSSCFKCGADRSGRSGFEGDVPRMRYRSYSSSGGGSSSSRPGWKSGDWICTRPGCNEHNFASRKECFRCNAPRDSSGRSNCWNDIIH